MNVQIMRWCGEYVFVFAALIIMKSGIFPFVLWWWFAPSDLTVTLKEATSLVFTVVSTIILLALGSVSRFRYALTASETLGAALILNVPFAAASFIPVVSNLSSLWWDVIGDGVKLWLPALSDGVFYGPIHIFLVFLGRRFYVRDQEFAAQHQKAKRMS